MSTNPMKESATTEVRLRFRINMLLAEQDMTLKQLYDRVKEMGFDVSSSHFYRQMKPYYSPIRLDLLSYVVQALNISPSELFDLVEVELGSDKPLPTKNASNTAQPIQEDIETEKVKKARKTAKQKRDLAMLGTKISVLPTSKN